MNPEKLQQIAEMHQFVQQLKRDSLGKTRREVMDLVHERIIGRGGQCADQRTRSYQWLFTDLFLRCKQLRTLEEQRQWDDEEMQEGLDSYPERQERLEPVREKRQLKRAA